MRHRKKMICLWIISIQRHAAITCFSVKRDRFECKWISHVLVIGNRFDSINCTIILINLFIRSLILGIKLEECLCTCCGLLIGPEFPSGSPLWPGHLVVGHIFGKWLSRSLQLGRNVRTDNASSPIAFLWKSDRNRNPIRLSLLAHDPPEPDINIRLLEISLRCRRNSGVTETATCRIHSAWNFNCSLFRLHCTVLCMEHIVCMSCMQRVHRVNSLAFSGACTRPTCSYNEWIRPYWCERTAFESIDRVVCYFTSARLHIPQCVSASDWDCRQIPQRKRKKEFMYSN